MLIEYLGFNICVHTSNSADEIPFEPMREKTNNLGSNKVRHKLACTSTEDGYRLEILDFERRGIVLSV